MSAISIVSSRWALPHLSPPFSSGWGGPDGVPVRHGIAFFSRPTSRSSSLHSLSPPCGERALLSWLARPLYQPISMPSR